MTWPAAMLTLLAGAAFAAEPSKPKLAGAVVRSKEYVVRREPKREEEFIGDVSYRQRGREFYSDWALRQEPERWKARGHVRIVWKREDGTVSRAWGERAIYDGISEKGSLFPKEGELLRFERALPAVAMPEYGNSRQLHYDGKSQTGRLEGDVHLWGPTGECEGDLVSLSTASKVCWAAAWAERADYEHESGISTLTGRRPVVTAIGRTAKGDPWSGALQGDRIRGHSSRLKADGDVQGWVVFVQDEKRKKRKKS